MIHINDDNIDNTHVIEYKSNEDWEEIDIREAKKIIETADNEDCWQTKLLKEAKKEAIALEEALIDELKDTPELPK